MRGPTHRRAPPGPRVVCAARCNGVDNGKLWFDSVRAPARRCSTHSRTWSRTVSTRHDSVDVGSRRCVPGSGFPALFSRVRFLASHRVRHSGPRCPIPRQAAVIIWHPSATLLRSAYALGRPPAVYAPLTARESQHQTMSRDPSLLAVQSGVSTTFPSSDLARQMPQQTA